MDRSRQPGALLSPEEIRARLDALGRPRPSGYVMHELALFRRAAAEWDRANPEAAAEWRRLSAEYERADTEAREQERQAKAAERAMKHLSVRLERSGAGELLLSQVAKPDPTETFRFVQRWRDDHGRKWCVLCGSTGTGKSFAATWVVFEALKAGDSAAVFNVSEFLTPLTFEEDARRLERARRVDWLVLDEYGAELMTDFARARFEALLDHRHQSNVRTIITSNLKWAGPGGMAARLGERMVDRIESSGSSAQFSGKSLRPKPPKEQQS
jgi:DNA replication protein DnaC